MEQKRYIYEILRSLERHGGRAELRPTIYGEVFDALKGDLTPNDLGDTNFGDEEKWTNEIRQARRTMIEYGLLEPKEITGVWEITTGGREYFAAYPNVRLWSSGGAKGMSRWDFDSDEDFV
jgi:hypothetical protein